MRRRQFLAGSSFGLLGMGALTSGLFGCQPTAPVAGPIIATPSGKIQGSDFQGIHRFLGIPYAEAPFGARRFLPPEPRMPWSDVLPADAYGPVCPQAGRLQPGTPAEGEDCLNLNVWTPALGAANLPVMVWLHGGAHVSGSGSLPIYEGQTLAAEGVVLVTCNRRLGAEGYLYLEELMGPGVGQGNLGIEDVIQVLRWVQQHIASFGGDPNNVTLFGQSYGASAAQAVVASPRSRGLMRRVIAQSGSYAAQRQSSANALAKHVLQAFGIAAGDLTALQAVPPSRFASLYPELRALGLGQPQAFLPMISEHMPVHPADAAHAGFGLDLDYLTGTCAAEATLFQVLAGDLTLESLAAESMGANQQDLAARPTGPLSAPEKTASVSNASAGIAGAAASSLFVKRVDQILAAANVDWATARMAYARALPQATSRELESAIMGDVRFWLPTQRVADGHAMRSAARTYTYRFQWPAPLLGPTHGMDLMLFGVGNPLAALTDILELPQIATTMRKAWVAFARNGDPSTTDVAWPEYGLATRATMLLDEQARVALDPMLEQRRLFGAMIANNWQAAGL